MSQPQRILITGASGFVGRALGTALAARGEFVIAVSRDPAAARADLPFAKGVVTWDQIGGIRDLDAVVNLAGESVAQRWTARAKERILSSRVGGLERLRAGLAKVQGRKPRVLISASAIGYYGDRGDLVLDEQAAPGIDFLATTCVAWEKAAQAVEVPRLVIPRIGMVLGKGGGALAKMVLPFQLGLGGRIGSGQQWVSWIHLDDLVLLLVRSLDQDSLRGVYNAVSPEPVRNADFTRSLAETLGRPASLPMPAFAARLALGEMAEMLLGGQRVSAQRLLANGFVFRYPSISAALRASL